MSTLYFNYLRLIEPDIDEVIALQYFHAIWGLHRQDRQASSTLF